MNMSNLKLNQWYHVDKTKYVYEHYIRFNGINQYQSGGHGDMLIYNRYWRWVENGPTNIRKDSVYTEIDESIINQLKAEML